MCRVQIIRPKGCVFPSKKKTRSIVRKFERESQSQISVYHSLFMQPVAGPL